MKKINGATLNRAAPLVKYAYSAIIVPTLV